MWRMGWCVSFKEGEFDVGMTVLEAGRGSRGLEDANYNQVWGWFDFLISQQLI